MSKKIYPSNSTFPVSTTEDKKELESKTGMFPSETTYPSNTTHSAHPVEDEK